jgi:glucose-6-phosphate 1-epimerase
MTELDVLTTQFAIDGQLNFRVNEAGFIIIEINNQFAQATISTYGGQILSYKPHTAEHDLLFLSEQAVYKDGSAIRGGTPICWPWFGDDLSGLGRPSHGFARNQPWQVVETKALTDGSTSVTLMLSHSDESLAVWPHQFELFIEMVVGKKLTLHTSTRNTGNKTFNFTQALHTYFNVSDISDVTVTGLSSKYYLDKLDSFELKIQEGNIQVEGAVDRIYQSAPYMVHLLDPGYKRKIAISSSGGHTTVVWNPWAEEVKNIKDLSDNSYRDFVCIETVNAADDDVVLNPNEQHTLSAVYNIESL